ncbi:MAG: hypothetical protein ACE5GE_13405 [Phycisphaerae bacterium]
MMQCADCEFFSVGPDGRPDPRCDPFSTIKEPECLTKLQFIKLDRMVRAYEATLEMYERLAPLQERMFRHMEQELDEADEADAWKYSGEDDDDDDDDAPPLGGSFTQ